jgi:tRNA/rRNA methyltransferase
MPGPNPLSNVRVVLVKTSHPGNIGAAARAMWTMGLRDLALVNPRHFPDPGATAMAAGAAELLAEASVHETLEAAIAGCTLAVGFSARRRDLSHAVVPVREAMASILAAAREGKVALVFGNETSGLSNEELARCQAFASIPANPEYSSLNLAAAVQIASYEVSIAALAHAVPESRGRDAATVGDLDGLFAHLERSARSSGFLDPQKPGRFVEHMRRLFARAKLERPEVKLLRGLLGALDGKAVSPPRAARVGPKRPPAAGKPAATSRGRSPPRKRKPS